MNWDDAAVCELQILLDQGFSQREIGVLMGCSKNTIAGKVRRKHLKPSPGAPKKPPQTVRERKASKRPRKPDPPAAPPVAVPEPALRLCGWVDGARFSYRRCDAPVWRHSAWCEEHYRRVFTTRRAIEAAA
jgi:GcrA cell cycle regulator